MSTITLDRDHLDIRFTVPERVGGLVKGQRVPVAAIRRVELVQNPIAATRGWRAPGLAVPGRRKVGHWRGRSGHELVAIRRGEPAIRVHLEGHHFASMLLGTPDAADLAERLADLIGPAADA